MSTTDKVDVVAIAKLSHNVFSEGEGYSSIVFSPLLDFLVGVRPQQIAQETGVGNVGWSNYVFDSVNFVKFWRETSVHA